HPPARRRSDRRPLANRRRHARAQRARRRPWQAARQVLHVPGRSRRGAEEAARGGGGHGRARQRDVNRHAGCRPRTVKARTPILQVAPSPPHRYTSANFPRAAMSILEHAAARILTPLSALLQKPLSLADSQSPEARQAFSVRSPIPRVSIVANDGKPFTEEQRVLLHEIFDVIRTAEENDARFRELEHRMMTLQRENLDLTVRNRVLSEVTTRDTLTGL